MSKNIYEAPGLDIISFQTPTPYSNNGPSGIELPDDNFDQ